ncbi:3-hydroxyacyl-CoA dehydrogenase [Halovivax cerinus]|uniref:3-hydroxyacyl-CoA dehydrogenase NAD-binding domain-containing protein n=1 Tax=Halovivax cerinus TaxID=1487865 RepID=A0ABD5NJQ9_9EURY|nr:3-hydroxyacyl-CoA dehydrogenase [Halovivax cerinus]
MTLDTNRHEDAPDIDRTGVVGAGVMGRDIAALLASAGYRVTLVDVDADALTDAETYHSGAVAGALADAGYEPPDDFAARITYDTDLDALADAAFVVEAVPEDLGLKRDLVGSLADVLGDEAILATNTSSLTPGEIAADVVDPSRVVLFHFANPAIPRDLVEVAGDEAADRVLETAAAMAAAIGKRPIRLAREYRANGLSRLSASIKCAATWELREATPAAIDTAATAVGFAQGPLELIDRIGLDVHLATVENLEVAYGDRYAPPTPVRDRMASMIEDGRLGQKSGEGFFEWVDGEAVVPDPEESHDVTPILAALVNEGHRLVDDGVANADTVDEILRRGSAGDVGPFDVESMLGRDFLRDTLAERYAETGAGVYEPVF